MQELLTILLLAVSLSMDTFSLSLCFGTMNVTKKQVYTLSIIVGIFHFIMPFIGLNIGNVIIEHIIVDSKYILLMILSIIGIDMIISSIKNEEKRFLLSFGGILLFAFSVSLDSFSTGLGLNLMTDNILFALSSFSICSFLFTYMGVKLGNKLSDKYGRTAGIIGGIVLILLGIYFFIK